MTKVVRFFAVIISVLLILSGLALLGIGVITFNYYLDDKADIALVMLNPLNSNTWVWLAPFLSGIALMYFARRKKKST